MQVCTDTSRHRGHAFSQERFTLPALGFHAPIITECKGMLHVIILETFAATKCVGLYPLVLVQQVGIPQYIPGVLAKGILLICGLL